VCYNIRCSLAQLYSFRTPPALAQGAPSALAPGAGSESQPISLNSSPVHRVAPVSSVDDIQRDLTLAAAQTPHASDGAQPVNLPSTTSTPAAIPVTATKTQPCASEPPPTNAPPTDATPVIDSITATPVGELGSAVLPLASPIAADLIPVDRLAKSPAPSTAVEEAPSRAGRVDISPTFTVPNEAPSWQLERLSLLRECDFGKLWLNILECWMKLETFRQYPDEKVCSI
jgi:hypothetical protein